MSQDLSSANIRTPKLSLDIVLRTHSNILDLSGTIPFIIYVEVSCRHTQAKIDHEAHSRPIDILTNGSILDVSSALKAGLLYLMEVQDDSPKKERKNRARTKIPTELLHDTAYQPLAEPNQLVRLLSGFSRPVIDPQCFECSLDDSIISILKNGCVYDLAYCEEAQHKRGQWQAGISWWKFCLDPAQPVDTSSPTDEPPAWVRKSMLPHFKAMMDPPRPPKLEYELEMSSNKISLSDANTTKITVRFRLKESNRYTVMWRRSNCGSKITALSTHKIGSFSFDIFDAATGERISGPPIYTNLLWSSGLDSLPIIRDQLREIDPGQTNVGEAEIYGGEDKKSSFLKYFRISDAKRVLDRKLELRLKAVDTFWSEKGIDELFEGRETIKREHWYIPLTIQSPAKAYFSVTA